MSKLDVEQQLRLLQEQRKAAGETSAAYKAHIEFLTQRNFDAVAQPAFVVSGSVLLMCCALAVVTLCTKSLRHRLAEGIQRAHASVFSSFFSPITYTCFMVVWAGVVAVNATFRLMEKASLVTEDSGYQFPISIADYRFLALPIGLFLTEYLGVIGLWLYPLGRSTYTMDIGLVAALLVFFPSLYQSLALDSDAPERVPVWTTHCVLLTSLFVLYAVGAPWLRREYHEVLRELRNHTKSALYRERPEARDLRARRDAKNKRK